MALEEWKLRLTSAKVEVEVEAELGKILSPTFLETSFCGGQVGGWTNSASTGVEMDVH